MQHRRACARAAKASYARPARNRGCRLTKPPPPGNTAEALRHPATERPRHPRIQVRGPARVGTNCSNASVPPCPLTWISNAKRSMALACPRAASPPAAQRPRRSPRTLVGASKRRWGSSGLMRAMQAERTPSSRRRFSLEAVEREPLTTASRAVSGSSTRMHTSPCCRSPPASL